MRRNTGDELFSKVGYLFTPEFYRQHPIINQKLGINGRLINEVGHSPFIGGLFDNVMLRLINLRDNNNSSLVKLILMIDNQSKKSIHPSKPNITRNAMKYKFDQMKFLENCYLPVPVPVHHAEIDKNIRVLISEFWPGPTHDLDIIAINEVLKNKRNYLNSNNFENRKTIEEQITQLENEKDKIVTSILRTINETAIYGTYHHQHKDNNLIVFKPKNPEKYFKKEKGEHYFGKIVLWNRLRMQGVSSDTLNNYKTKKFSRQGTKEIEKYVIQAKKEFDALTDFLIEPLVDESKFRYIHGDECPHNFKYKGFKNGSFTVKSGAFDWDHSMYANPTWSKGKALTSFIFNLNHEKQMRKFIESLYDARNIKKEFMSKEKIDPRDIYVETNIEDAALAFDLTAIFETICHMGREAQDDLINKEYYSESLENATWPYRKLWEETKFIKFPSYQNKAEAEEIIVPETVSCAVYSPTNAIPLLKEKLTERFKIMLGESETKPIYFSTSNYKSIREPIYKFKQLCDKHKLTTE